MNRRNYESILKEFIEDGSRFLESGYGNRVDLEEGIALIEQGIEIIKENMEDLSGDS